MQWTYQLFLDIAIITLHEEECASLLSKYDFLFCIMAAKFVPGVCQQGSSTQLSKASFILSDLRLYSQGTIGRHYAFYWVPWVREVPGGGDGNLLQYSCLEKPVDRGAWPDYSPWGHEELETAEVTDHAWAMILERKG